MRGNSGLIGPPSTKTAVSATGIHGAFDQYNGMKDGKWPHFQINSVTSNNGTNLNDNVTSIFTVTTSGAVSSIPLYFTIENVSGPALSASDFAGISESGGVLYGSFTVTSSNSATFNIKPVGDSISESNVVKVSIRRGGILNDPLFETGNLTIGDAATPTGDDITTSFYEISNRFIASDTYMGSTADYNGAYDVGQVQTDFIGTGRVYIGVKVTASTTYYNDIPIAGIQVISSNGSTLVASWIFNTSTGGSGSGWQTYTSQIAGTSTVGFPVSPATASAYSYVAINNTTAVGKFTWATSTGSSNTGAADGIGNAYKLSADGGSNTLATVGDAQISQTTSTYYAYRETSGSTRYYGAVMRSPTYTFGGGEYIRVIHAVTGYSGSQMSSNDSLYVAVY